MCYIRYLKTYVKHIRCISWVSSCDILRLFLSYFRSWYPRIHFYYYSLSVFMKIVTHDIRISFFRAYHGPLVLTLVAAKKGQWIVECTRCESYPNLEDKKNILYIASVCRILHSLLFLFNIKNYIYMVFLEKKGDKKYILLSIIWEKI